MGNVMAFTLKSLKKNHLLCFLGCIHAFKKQTNKKNTLVEIKKKNQPQNNTSTFQRTSSWLWKRVSINTDSYYFSIFPQSIVYLVCSL